MMLWQALRDDLVFGFRKHRDLAEQALVQISDDVFFQKPGEHSNSIALIVKHVAGNLTSRWTDFLTTDGEKPWRDRDSEFLLAPTDTRASLQAAWDKGFSILFQALAALREEDLLKTISIRGEAHLVLQAAQRSLTHTAYHVGQITYLCRLLTKGDWKWLTIAPGQSKQHDRKYLR